MKRLLFSCGLVLLTIASDCAWAQGTLQPVSLVIHVDAGKRKPPAISISDLVIFDNDSKVNAVSEVEPALSREAVFAIVVDASGSNLDKVDFIKKSVADIFDAATTSAGSRGLLFVFGDRIEGSNTWVSRVDVQQAMRSFRVKQGARSPLYAAVIQAARRLAASDLGKTVSRRLLFVVTDGDDTPAGVTRQDAVNACLSTGVTIIPIGLLSYNAEKVGRANLSNLADATGGRAVILNGPADVKAMVADVLKSEYVVTFTPPNAGAYHNLRIELPSAPKGVSVKAPEGYYSH